MRCPIDSVDDVLAEAARRGLVLCNMFQFVQTGTGRRMWRSNFIGGGFGEATTPQESIALALRRAPPPADPFADLLG